MIKNTKRCIIVSGWLITVMSALFIMIGSHAFAAADAIYGNKTSGGMLKKQIEEGQDLLNVVLIGATQYEFTELFDDILIKTPGVVEAKRFRFFLDPDRPKVCRVDWQVQVENMTPFELESTVFNRIKDIARTGNTEHLPFKMTADHQKLLTDIRPLHATNREIQFHFFHLAPKHANQSISGYVSERHWPDTGFE
jgi:hypothetical protein